MSRETRAPWVPSAMWVSPLSAMIVLDMLHHADDTQDRPRWAGIDGTTGVNPFGGVKDFLFLQRPPSSFPFAPQQGCKREGGGGPLQKGDSLKSLKGFTPAVLFPLRNRFGCGSGVRGEVWPPLPPPLPFPLSFHFARNGQAPVRARGLCFVSGNEGAMGTVDGKYSSRSPRDPTPRISMLLQDEPAEPKRATSRVTLAHNIEIRGPGALLV